MAGGDLVGLSRPLHRRRRPMPRHPLGVERCRDQGRPDRSRRLRVDADPLPDQLFGERAGERDNRAPGSGIVDEPENRGRKSGSGVISASIPGWRTGSAPACWPCSCLLRVRLWKSDGEDRGARTGQRLVYRFVGQDEKSEKSSCSPCRRVRLTRTARLRSQRSTRPRSSVIAAPPAVATAGTRSSSSARRSRRCADASCRAARRAASPTTGEPA